MSLQDLLRQRLRSGDRIRVNHRAKKKFLHGAEGEVVGYTNVTIMVDGVEHNIVPTSLDTLED